DLYQRNLASLQSAAAHFQNATSLDPNFALAYAALAESYAVLASLAPPAERARLLSIADEAARNALRLSPDLAEGHAVRGAIEQNRWHLRSALEELKRALEINPNLALAHHWRSINLYAMGDPAGALREDELARRL